MIIIQKSLRVSVYAVLINLLLFLLKYSTALLSNSISLRAEAFHSLSDVVASLTIFAGLKIAGNKTRMFPYGLYKVENVVSIIISFVIFFAGYEIVRQAVTAGRPELRHIWLAVAGLTAAILITYGFSRYEAGVAKRLNSPSLAADSEHIKTDMFTNGVVLAALISNYLGYSLDKIAAYIVVVFIFISGGRLFLNGSRVLLDASLDYQTLKEAEGVMLGFPQVVEVMKIKGRNSGSFKFLEASIVIKTNDLQRAHKITDKIDNKIKERFSNIEEVMIHYEPVVQEKYVYAVPVEGADNSQIHPSFGKAPYFMLYTYGCSEGEITVKETIKNPLVETKKGQGILVAEYLVKQGIDAVILSQDLSGKAPYYVFAAGNVEVVHTDKKEGREAVMALN